MNPEDVDTAVDVPDFDALYRSDPDPWRVADSWYEQRKRAVLLAALPQPHYATAWEPGCGPGITTAALAPRVDRLVATDGSAVAVDLARRRCAGLPGVEVARSMLPERPEGRFALVVAAEFLYYLADLDAGLSALAEASAPGAHLAFVHWAHRPHDGHLSGADLHARLRSWGERLGAEVLVTHRDRDFVLDVLELPA